jgi:thiamine kinase-like enzyme
MSWFSSNKVKKLEQDVELVIRELIKTRKKLERSEDKYMKLIHMAAIIDKRNDRLIAENERLKAGSTSRSSGLTQKQVETAIRLCHPDKHNGSKAANDLTVTLLELRT